MRLLLVNGELKHNFKNATGYLLVPFRRLGRPDEDQDVHRLVEVVQTDVTPCGPPPRSLKGTPFMTTASRNCRISGSTEP